MRILATGDSHLGKGLDLGRQPGDRLAEQEQVWADTLELARDRRVDAVLHAGDLFDGRRPTPEILLAAERPLVEHQEQGGATVYVVAGNHDVPSQDGPCGLDVLAEAGLIELAREPLTWTIGRAGVIGGLDVVDVCALPWTSVSRLVALNEDADRGDIHALAADLLIQAARGLAAQAVSWPRPRILLGHWSVSQTSLPNGLDVGSLGGVVLPMDDLRALGFDEIIFGHIHRPQTIGEFRYVGSPMPLDFGEGSTDHGVWIHDTIDGPGVSEFVPLASRPFVTIDVDRGGSYIGTDDVRDAYVKVRATLTEDEARADSIAGERETLEMLGAYRVWFDVTVERAHRDRGVQLAEGLTPLDQLAAYLDARGVNGDVKPALLARAERHLA